MYILGGSTFYVTTFLHANLYNNFLVILNNDSLQCFILNCFIKL